MEKKVENKISIVRGKEGSQTILLLIIMIDKGQVYTATAYCKH